MSQFNSPTSEPLESPDAIALAYRLRDSVAGGRLAHVSAHVDPEMSPALLDLLRETRREIDRAIERISRN